MRWSPYILVCLFCLISWNIEGQIAADCSNAIPICNNTPINSGTVGYGIDDFNGATSSGCLEQTVSGAIESNSAWYRFRTGASGQLGFNIGFDTSEDWDFALYKSSDCGNLGEPVRCNFFDNRDEDSYMGVGEDPTGNMGSFLYEEWLDVSPGEDYYLLINNFSNTNSGFSIQFSGEIFVTNPFDALDCSIIDNLLGPPVAACENDTVILDATTNDVLSYTWYMDTGSGYQVIPGETSATLNVTVSAMYRVEVIRTTMSNLISDVQVGFSPVPVTYPLNDVTTCTGSLEFDLTTKDVEALGPQDAEDFVVSYHESSADATSGANPLPDTLSLSSGTKTIFLRVVSITNQACADVSQTFRLQVDDTPALIFPEDVWICENSSGIEIGEMNPDPRFSYSWDNGAQTSSITVSTEGTYTLTAINTQSAEACEESRSVHVIVSETPRITDVIIEDLQQDNTVQIVTDQVGPYEYRLDDGPLQSSNTFTNVAPGMHTVTIDDPKGCGSVTENISVVGFPKFFTPNGDGMHDYWHIIGIETLNDPQLMVFDRYGKLLKQLDENSLGWDGTFNGQTLPSSDYWFRLSYVDMQGQRVEAKFLNNHFSLRR